MESSANLLFMKAPSFARCPSALSIVNSKGEGGQPLGFDSSYGSGGLVI